MLRSAVPALRRLSHSRAGAAGAGAANTHANAHAHGNTGADTPRTLPAGFDFVAQPPRELLPRGVQDKLAEYPVSVTVPVEWGHQDMFGHVNNVHYFRFMENARMELMMQAYLHMTPELHDELIRAKGIGVILSTSSIVYKAPVVYPDSLTVGCRISEWKDDRFLFQYRLVSHKLDRIAAEGDGWMVVYDYRLKKKTSIPPHLKYALEAVNARRFSAPA